MSYNPGVGFFISFHELETSEQNRCIFFTQKGARCKNYCDEKDNRRARFLRDSFFKAPTSLLNIETLTEYALCNCCRRAKHRDRIEDVELLSPLAQRWFEEIRLRASRFIHIEALPSCVRQYNDGLKITGASSTQVKDAQFPVPDISSCDSLSIPTSSRTFEKSSILGTSHIFPKPSLASPKVLTAPLHSLQTSSRYELRNRQMDGFENDAQILPSYPPQKLRSEFRPHINDPSPDDCVYRKMLDPLEDRDFETGRLYIFDRISSPGHVKIGWTAKSVSSRLISWSNCGYSPNLLFKTSPIHNAMRAETLTHYEFIKEWRRERMCKGPGCGKSHKEWFEINAERAKQVVSHWATFMERARPYDEGGLLKPQWKEVIERIHNKSELVTAEKLLVLYTATLIEQETVPDKAVILLCAPKIKEDISILRPMPTVLKAVKKENMPGDLPLVKHSKWPEDTDLDKTGSSWRKPTENQLAKSKISMRRTSMRRATPVLDIVRVKKELTPEEIPLPPSPSSEPVGPLTAPSSPQRPHEDSGAGVELPTTKDSVTNANTKNIDATACNKPDSNSGVLLSTQDSAVSTISSQALTKGPVTPIKNSSDALSSPTNISLFEIPLFSARITSSDRLARHDSTKLNIESLS